jgi:hypothetical protein
MASSLAHMQILLDKCQNFSEKWNIKFNANKSIMQINTFIINKLDLRRVRRLNQKKKKTKKK